MLSTTIKPKYQEKILQKEDAYIFEEKFDYDACLNVLQFLYSEYNWSHEEDKRDLGNKEKLSYYAVLMTEWVKSNR